MKNFTRRLFGRFYTARYSHVLSYKGSWRKGTFHGHGILTYRNGGIYEGTFRFGAKHGFGTLSSASGYRYEGEWVNGEQTGLAKISYKNGDWYEGAVKNGIRHGLGELSEPASKRIFKGFWKNGTIEGDVQITDKKWNFHGSFPDKYGRAKGTMLYPDGSTYFGEVNNFTRHGDGRFYGISGSEIKGRWVDDMNVDHAISTDSEGIQWWGAFRNLKPQGFMKVQLPNGHKYDGVWLNGQLQRALSVRNRRNAEPVYHFH